jgi:hypothetical protein
MGRGSAIGLAAALAAPGMLGASVAWAGAWPEPAGQTQVIFKFEDEQAGSAFDPDGNKVSIPHLSDDNLSVFFERGLTDRLTLQGQAGLTQGEDEFIHYSGRGPIALGLRYALIHRPKWVVSLYVGGVYDGVGRNAGYALPHQGNSDVEVRMLAGRSGVWKKRPVFAEVQVARLVRSGLPDETHIDATAGVTFAPNWQLFLQSYNGRADSSPVAPEWSKLEASVVRKLGRWSLQAGWRETVWGREDPITGGPVVAVWLRF